MRTRLRGWSLTMDWDTRKFVAERYGVQIYHHDPQYLIKEIEAWGMRHGQRTRLENINLIKHLEGLDKTVGA